MGTKVLMHPVSSGVQPAERPSDIQTNSVAGLTSNLQSG